MQRGLLAVCRGEPQLEPMSDTDPIPRLNAALEGRYRIEAELGEGGMAPRVRTHYGASLNKWGLPVPPPL